MAGLDELLGESAAIEAVRESIRRLLMRPQAGRRLPAVLILGETGTGKGLVARLMHRLGPRAGGSFVDVNCAAIPDTLLEAELFGFERGAFTDARRSKPGLFQTAHNGTIFLDEIGLLPAALQAKLLKVLEERAVRRLGGTTSEPADVWVISATNADLQAAIAERTFREDLYHRLAVITLHLPALRDRGQDALLLAERFLARACADYGLPAKSFSPKAQSRLLAYPWPGNVREVANVAERLALLAEDDVVGADSLDLAAPAPAASAKPPVPQESSRSLDEAMSGHLLDALARTGWNISRTATLLDISRNTVRARIRKYGLREGAERAAAWAPRQSARPASMKAAQDVPEQVSAPTRIRWERRRITLLRAEIAPLGEGGPEAEMDSPSGSARVLETLIDKIRGFGGHIDELGQTGIGAVFGLEPAEDTPQRAAHAALTIGKAVERLQAEEQTPFGVRLAIHTGQFAVARLAAGTEIDAASRREAASTLVALLQEAESGAILVSAAVRPFLARRFKLVQAGREPAGAYRLVGHEQHGLGPVTQLSAFVGRAQQLAMLESRLGAATSGRGQLVSVVGEAGIGKSRLLYEFRRRAKVRGVGYVEGHCVSYGGSIPYLPVLDLIRQGFGLTEADPPGLIAEKIHAGLEILKLASEELDPYLLRLLGFKEGTELLERLSPEAVKARSFDALRRITVRANQIRPMIIAVEDLHWIDRTSEELLATLAEGLPGTPVLLVVTYRSGYRPPWSDKSYATQIPLSPLSSEESRTLTRSIGSARELPEPLSRMILSRAEGNPFFLEELTRAIAERRDLRGDVAVPETVQGVLMTRIERLADEPKRMLQTASVLGRVVPLRVLEAMWGDAAASAVHLRELERLEFLHEQDFGNERAYGFKHALTHEVAYESLLEPQRREIHLAAARAIETLHAGRLDDVCDRLGYHYARTGEAAKAVEYLTRAADRAASRHADAEAVDSLELALGRVPELAPEVRDRLTLGLVLRLAGSLMNLGRFQEIIDLLAAHVERLDRVADPGLTGLFHFQAGLVWSFVGDNERSQAHARTAFEASREAGDQATMGKAQYVLALDGVWLGRPQEVIAHGTTAVALLERTGEHYWLALAHWILGLNYALVGRFDEALGEEAMCSEIGASVGSPRLLSYAGWATGTIRAFMGDAVLGIEGCRRSLERSPDPFNTATATGFLGYAYLENGQPREAIEHLERAIEMFGSFHYRHAQGLFTAYLSSALYLAGNPARARQVAADVIELDTRARFHYGKGLVRLVEGRIALAEGAHARALELFTEARAVFVSIEAQHEVARTELAVAELAHARGDAEACRSHAINARGLFVKLGVPRYVERAERLAGEWGVPLPIEGGGQRS